MHASVSTSIPLSLNKDIHPPHAISILFSKISKILTMPSSSFDVSSLHKDAASYQSAFPQDLAHDSDLIRDALLSFMRNVIVKKLSSEKQAGKEEVTISFWDLHHSPALDDKALRSKMKTRMKPTTFFTGMWDRDRKEHDLSLWEKAGKGLMVEELRKAMLPCLLVDATNLSLSKHRVLQVTVPASV